MYIQKDNWNIWWADTVLCFYVTKYYLVQKVRQKLPGGVGRRHMVLKCLGVVLQSSAEVEREFPAEDPLEFWDDGWL